MLNRPLMFSIQIILNGLVYKKKIVLRVEFESDLNQYKKQRLINIFVDNIERMNVTLVFFLLKKLTYHKNRDVSPTP